MDILKKICCLFAIAMLLISSVETAHAEKNLLIFKFYSNLVIDQKSGVKLFVWSNNISGKSGMTYEWLGGSLNGFAQGKGTVNEFENGVLMESYTGTFDHGKMHGHFVGQSYGNYLSNNEWYCTDGYMYGKAVFAMNDGSGKIVLFMENNVAQSGYVFLKNISGNNDGSSMELTVKNGEPVSGKLKFAEGYYEGSFNNNGINGTGILKMYNGITYEGEFLNNKMHGKGKLTFPNGSVFIGDFIEGSAHGYGTLYDHSGKIIRQGTWDTDNSLDLT